MNTTGHTRHKPVMANAYQSIMHCIMCERCRKHNRTFTRWGCKKRVQPDCKTSKSKGGGGRGAKKPHHSRTYQ